MAAAPVTTVADTISTRTTRPDLCRTSTHPSPVATIEPRMKGSVRNNGAHDAAVSTTTSSSTVAFVKVVALRPSWSPRLSRKQWRMWQAYVRHREDEKNENDQDEQQRKQTQFGLLGTLESLFVEACARWFGSFCHVAQMRPLRVLNESETDAAPTIQR